MTHVDDDGFAAVVMIMAGSKLWVLMGPPKNAVPGDFSGDLSSIDAFPQSFEQGSSGKGVFSAEAVYLTGACCL
jgi:hypothetical protein